ncbi:hypothetical protein LB505_011940 [Fusarium chuoi]|nr:hypothetical protein LB505_011940 [Fusarium chuoi]
MRCDRNDRYERVKIAIIDSGLHDRERSRYLSEYQDFTGVPTNDSWHGTCCAGIIQGMYEEARLPSIGLSSHLTPSILSVSQLVSATTPRNSMMP